MPCSCVNSKAGLSEATLLPGQLIVYIMGYRIEREREKWQKPEYNEREFGLEYSEKSI